MTTNNSTLGVFGSIKHVIISICNQLVKLCEVSETSLDAVHDIAKTGKVYTKQMHDEAELTATKELEELNAS